MLLTIMQRTDVPSIVHGAVTAMGVLRCLTVPGDVVGDAAKVVLAMCEGATGPFICDNDSAAGKPEVPGDPWFNVERAVSPAPGALR